MWSDSRAGLGVTEIKRAALAGLGVPWPHENARSPCGEKRATTRDEARTEPSPGGWAGSIANAIASQQRRGVSGPVWR
jgi:hypothetical protein